MVSGLTSYSAAEMAARARALATPATIHAPSLAHDVEDHASLAPSAIAFTEQSLDLIETILAVEVLLATQALENGERPRTLGAQTSRARDLALEAIARAGETGAAGVLRDLGPALLDLTE